jgi:hypothetical protein
MTKPEEKKLIAIRINPDYEESILGCYVDNQMASTCENCKHCEPRSAITKRCGNRSSFAFYAYVKTNDFCSRWEPK